MCARVAYSQPCRVHNSPCDLFAFSAEGKHGSYRGEHFLSHCTSRSVLCLLFAGEGCSELGQDSSTQDQEWREAQEEEGDAPLLGKCHCKASEESGNPLNQDGKLVPNSSVDLVNVTVSKYKTNRDDCVLFIIAIAILLLLSVFIDSTITKQIIMFSPIFIARAILILHNISAL